VSKSAFTEAEYSLQSPNLPKFFFYSLCTYYTTILYYNPTVIDPTITHE